MVLPRSASDVLRQVSPRKMLGNSFFSQNRFSNLRESSPVARSQSIGGRDRSQSVKRKFDTQGVSYAQVVHGPAKPMLDDSTLALIESSTLDTAKVQSLCTKISENILNLDASDPVKDILNDMCDAIAGLGKTQEGILTVLRGTDPQIPRYSFSGPNLPPSQDRQMFNLGNVPKKQRTHGESDNRYYSGKGPSQTAGQSHQNTVLLDPEANEAIDPAQKKFRDAVREAEKSTLVFNLDMGRFPTLNQEKMASQATLALTKMAAAKEGKTSGIPSEDAISMIDDITSVTKSVRFFGKTTKPCKGNKKQGNAEFYTVPVKYEFKDKETRVRVEQNLRKICDIQCSTPYPPILRECIRQTIAEIKVDYPEDFIRVNVDVQNRTLKAWRRPPGNGEDWRKLNTPIPLPDDVLDVTSRRIPDGLKITLPLDIYSPGRQSRLDKHNREKSKSPIRGDE